MPPQPLAAGAGCTEAGDANCFTHRGKAALDLLRQKGPTRGSDQSSPSGTGPCKHPCTRAGCSSRYQLPSHFHSFCRAFLLSGLTGTRILLVCLPDFHGNIFSRAGYISNQLLHHSMFQHKYMQCSAATILLGVLLCITDCRKNHISLPAPMPGPPPSPRTYRAHRAAKHASLASLHGNT